MTANPRYGAMPSRVACATRSKNEAELAKDETIILEGRAYGWREVCEARRVQREARRSAQGKQLALFELHEDHRPSSAPPRGAKLARSGERKMTLCPLALQTADKLLFTH
jgi:hypothetical protein